MKINDCYIVEDTISSVGKCYKAEVVTEGNPYQITAHSYCITKFSNSYSNCDEKQEADMAIKGTYERLTMQLLSNHVLIDLN